MGTSSLVGIDRTPGAAPGHDSDLLGPSDSSDSGSDVAGLGEPETVGPGVDSDSRGTGERRSAGGDAGAREAADISPDRIVGDPNRSDVRDDDPDGSGDVDAGDELLDASSLDDDEDIEDEDAEPVGTPPR